MTALLNHSRTTGIPVHRFTGEPAPSYRSRIGEPEDTDSSGLFVLLVGFVLGGITGAGWALGIAWWVWA